MIKKEQVNNPKVKITVTKDSIHVGCQRYLILPAYLHYLFESRNIDYKDKDIHFYDITCRLVRDGVLSRWE